MSDGQIGTSRHPVAHKDHSCDWCVETITKGTKYEEWTWSDNGKLFTVRAHEECTTAWGDEGPDAEGTGECQRGMSYMDSDNWCWNNPECCDCGKRFPIAEDEDRETCAACQKLEADNENL